MQMVAHENQRQVESQPEESEAFERIIHDNQRVIHALCYRMTGSMDDAADLAQETFIHAFRNLDQFRGESKISSWLYRIAINQCLSWRKHQERERVAHEELSKIAANESPCETHCAQEIQDALMQLPPKQRAAIVLTTYEGLNHAQAACALGCSETTISWRLFEARRKLKRLLKRLKTTGGAK